MLARMVSRLVIAAVYMTSSPLPAVEGNVERGKLTGRQAGVCERRRGSELRFGNLLPDGSNGWSRTTVKGFESPLPICGA